MKQVTYTIHTNNPLTQDVYRMVLEGDTSAITAPGQFVNLKLDGLYLRRPISVCDWDADGLTLIYKVVGQGTDQLSKMQPGDTLDALAGLGNGYDLAACPNDPVLVGGGVGVPPLYGLAKWLIRAGKSPSAILGFNRTEEIFYDMEFAALGIPVTVTTVDGTAGLRGFVTDAMPVGCRRPPSDAADPRNGSARSLTDAPYVCACGPEPMLKAVHRLAAGGQFSFEARMGCGFGACMGCTCETLTGYKRICKDGPVLGYEEIKW